MEEKKKEFEKMGIESLMEWYKSEESTEAEIDVWRKWEYQVKAKAPEYFRQMDLCQLNEFYRNNPHDDIPVWHDAWTQSFIDSWPFEEILGRLRAIETTLDVIIKAVGDTDPKISLIQLIRLKGGYQ